MEFKKAFWTAYQAGRAPRKILEELSIPEGTSIESKEALTSILNEVKYLRQEVEFLKKLSKQNIQQ